MLYSLKTTIIALFFCCSFCVTHAQIVFPKDFHCEEVEYKYKTALMYNGRIRIMRDLQTDKASPTMYPDYQKTKDNIYWKTGKADNQYYYELYVGEFYVRVTSKHNNKEFANYSKWILKKVRASKDKGVWFLDYKGEKPCN